jgi:hypothetical protein
MTINRRTHSRIASLAASMIHNPYLAPEASSAGSYLEGAKPRYARLQVKPSQWLGFTLLQCNENCNAHQRNFQRSHGARSLTLPIEP